MYTAVLLAVRHRCRCCLRALRQKKSKTDTSMEWTTKIGDRTTSTKQIRKCIVKRCTHKLLLNALGLTFLDDIFSYGRL